MSCACYVDVQTLVHEHQGADELIADRIRTHPHAQVSDAELHQRRLKITSPIQTRYATRLPDIHKRGDGVEEGFATDCVCSNLCACVYVCVCAVMHVSVCMRRWISNDARKDKALHVSARAC